jgi:acyl-CoA thioesterase-2
MGDNELIGVLSLEEVGPDRYVGQNLRGSQAVIFGGQLLAQTIAAAARTHPDMSVKSMHTVFARGGSPDEAVLLEVERLHAGRTFGSAQVTISQRERLCTQSVVLFDRPDADLIRHQDDAPDVAAPEQCPPRPPGAHGWELRIPDGVDIGDPDAVGPPELFVWSRFSGVPEDAWFSQALLSYASDGFLIGTAMRPHPGVGQALAHVSVSTSVITQTLTFHDSFDAGDWLLLAHRSPWAGHGRSYGRADVFTRDGRMVASYAQENMIRAFTAERRPAPGERSKY